ncbi:hypothetical protein V6N11_031247 [Hibiscus sabdariffa]|uniref:DUF4283 domain-containing protein n=1 Tax=Hibiscus sabdariffa TaxID=183260 RepID=A0ABR2SX23_9ROSI
MLSLSSISFLSSLMVYLLRSTSIPCSLGGFPSALDCEISKYGRILFLRNIFPLRNDCKMDLRGKLISSNPVDDNAVVRAFQGIWKNDKIVHITSLKPRYYRIKFPTEDIRNDILARGPWTFKGDCLALAASNPDNSIDDYTFFTMNVWIRIYGIPSVLMEDDDTANHIGNSLGNMVGVVVKVDTRRIDLNMVDYLRIGIILDVTKPVRRCVAIGGSGPSPKLCPLQYECLPTLCHGCGLIGHALEHCTTFKLEVNSKLQYGDWLRYIPPKKQEPQSRSKGSIRYLAGAKNTTYKITEIGTSSSAPIPTESDSLLKKDVAAVNTPNRSIPRAPNVPTDSIPDKHPSMAAATELGVTTKALSVADIAPVGAKLANAAMMETLSHTKVDVNNKAQIDKVLESSTNDPLGSTMVSTLNNLEELEGFIDFLNTTNETSSEVPYLLDNVGMDAAPNTLLPIPREGGLEYDLGKSFLATSNMLDIFDACISNQSFPHTAKIDEDSPLLIPRGTKRRLSMPHDSKFKKARPPPIISKTRAGMSSVKNSLAEVVSQPRRGK